MGIKGFNKAMKTMAPEAFGRMSVDKFSGKRIVFDTPGIAWRSLAVGQRRAVDASDVLVEGVNYAIRQKFFITHMLNMVKKFLKLSIVPIFVFEGTAPPEKACAWSRREKQRASTRKKIADMEETIKNLHV